MDAELPTHLGVFHHIGVACRDLAREERAWLDLGYRREHDPFSDSGQGVWGVFLVGGGPRLELLEQLEGSDVLEPWLRSGSRMYHLAYEVVDLEHSIERVRGQRGRVVRAPLPAPAFDGRLVCFLMLANRSVIELIEGPAHDR
jgi:methylmalonyl-CoA/ethylmalonyl-CoA epimerase